MRQRSGQLLAPTRALGAALLALGVGLTIGLRREPASAPSAVNSEPAEFAASLSYEPAASRSAFNGQLTASSRADPPTLAVKCRMGLASCRKWVALRERNGRLLVHSAQR